MRQNRRNLLLKHAATVPEVVSQESLEAVGELLTKALEADGSPEGRSLQYLKLALLMLSDIVEGDAFRAAAEASLQAARALQLATEWRSPLSLPAPSTSIWWKRGNRIWHAVTMPWRPGQAAICGAHVDYGDHGSTPGLPACEACAAILSGVRPSLARALADRPRKVCGDCAADNGPCSCIAVSLD